MEVRDRDTSDLVAAYRYNGLNFRIGWHSDVTDDSGGDPDGVVDEHDPWFWFCYDDRWRVVAVFRDDDEHPKEVFVHHNAGLAGYGGSSYIDSVILRDRDTMNAWHEEARDVRGERVYYAQNWRGDVSALLTDTGSMIEWVKYSAYGVAFSLPAGDTDSDGSWSEQDKDRIEEAIEEFPVYDVRYDTDLDGIVTSADITHANSIAGGYQTLGRGVLSSPAVANRVGYAGYRYDPTFKGAGRTIYHVRHRVYDAEVGRWTRRDPLGYVDGMSVYEYVRSMPILMIDSEGLLASTIGACGYLEPYWPGMIPGRDWRRQGPDWNCLPDCRRPGECRGAPSDMHGPGGLCRQRMVERETPQILRDAGLDKRSPCEDPCLSCLGAVLVGFGACGAVIGTCFISGAGCWAIPFVCPGSGILVFVPCRQCFECLEENSE